MKISLCIPTNGVIEWISKVIDSIYMQCVPLNSFEVVIVDNGDSLEFSEYIRSKMNEYPNLRYKRVKCPIFMNEIVAYKIAEGDFVKFVNHRTVLLNGTLEKWITFMEKNAIRRPIVYFSNGVLDLYYREYRYESFDDFIRNLSYWSSWSTGMAMWKSDIETLDAESCSELFPHTEILFRKYKGREYIIDNNIYLDEIPHTSKKKGVYDLFYAFSVEYPSLLLSLYQRKDISADTFVGLKSELLDFIIALYQTFCEKKVECSYDLSGFDSNIRIFYTQDSVKQRGIEKEERFELELQKRMRMFKETNRGVVVYGAGKKGRMYVEREGIENIICFIDSDVKKHHELRYGIPIVSLDEYIGFDIHANVKICVGEQDKAAIRMILLDKGMAQNLLD